MVQVVELEGGQHGAASAIARKTGLSVSTVSHLIRGFTRISPRTAPAFARAYPQLAVAFYEEAGLEPPISAVLAADPDAAPFASKLMQVSDLLQVPFEQANEAALDFVVKFAGAKGSPDQAQ